MAISTIVWLLHSFQWSSWRTEGLWKIYNHRSATGKVAVERQYKHNLNLELVHRQTMKSDFSNKQKTIM